MKKIFLFLFFLNLRVITLNGNDSDLEAVHFNRCLFPFYIKQYPELNELCEKYCITKDNILKISESTSPLFSSNHTLTFKYFINFEEYSKIFRMNLATYKFSE